MHAKIECVDKLRDDKTSRDILPSVTDSRAKVVDLPLIFNQKLPPEAIQKIKEHPLYHLLEGARREGYQFDLNAFAIEGTRNLMDVDNMSDYSKGETIQANLIKKILDEALTPQASNNSKKIPLSFRVFDSAETNGLKAPAFNEGVDFEMRDLKAANPGMDGVSRSAVREKLGIEKTDFVISIYGKFGIEDILDLQKKYEKAGKRVVVLWTGEGKINPDTFASGVRQVATYRGIKAERLTQLKEGGPSPTIIINDSVGVLPSLHAAANVAVVRGAVNFQEPLNSRTPTLAFTDSGAFSRGEYDPATYQGQIDIAQRSGAFSYALSTNGKIPDAVDLLSLSRQKVAVAPWQSSDTSQLSPFDKLLDQIYNFVKPKIPEEIRQN